MSVLKRAVRSSFLALCLLGYNSLWAQIGPPSGPPAGAIRIALPGNVFARLENSAPTGIFIEAVDAILKKMGYTPTYINMPTGDAIADLKEGLVGAATVVVPTTRVRELALISEPVVKEYNLAVTLKDKGFNLAAVSDFQGKKIGARIGYQYPLLEDAKNIELIRYRTDGEMLRSLLFGTTQVAMVSGTSDIYAMRSEGIMTRLEILKTSAGVVPLVMAFSKKLFDKARVDAFDAELRAFKTTPEYDAILERNGMADLVKDWPILTK
jgi:ABC-type amino acid transport substrate-binding protein